MTAPLHHPDGKTPVPARITAALEDRYGPQVDIDLGGREPMVDRWEDGTLTPTAAQIHLLAAYTGYPVAWFYEPVPEVTGLICFRRKVNGSRCHRVTPQQPQYRAETLF